MFMRLFILIWLYTNAPTKALIQLAYIFVKINFSRILRFSMDFDILSCKKSHETVVKVSSFTFKVIKYKIHLYFHTFGPNSGREVTFEHRKIV